MADHRAEQVLAAFASAVTGLTTTGANVIRARVYPEQEADMPALSVFMGADVPPEPGDERDTYPYLDCVLQIIVRLHAQGASVVLDTTLNQIRKEVAVAIMADTSLGLSNVVVDAWEGEADQPDLSGEGKQRIASQDVTWYVKYRRSYTDPSQ